MSVVIRTDEEIMELQNEASEAFDEGDTSAGKAVDVLDWLTSQDAARPTFEQ